MRNVPIIILSAVDTASQTGSGFYVGQKVAASFVPVFGDATAAGTVKIQGSNDAPVGKLDLNAYQPGNSTYADITGATSTIASGVGPAIILATMNFQYIRAVYTRSGGGSTTVQIMASVLDVSA